MRYNAWVTEENWGRNDPPETVDFGAPATTVSNADSPSFSSLREVATPPLHNA